MTVASVPQLLVPDPALIVSSGGVAFTSFLIDAAAEKVGFVFRVPKDGNLARVGFRTGAVTTADTLKVSFQDVSATTGDPDGVVDQFRTIASGSVTANTWLRTGLMTSDGTDGGVLRAVTRGQIVAAVVEFNAFVAGSVNIATWALSGIGRGPWVQGPAYIDHFTAAWAKSSSAALTLAVEYDDGTFAFIPGTLPFLTITNTSFNSGSTPDELALKFRLTAPVRVSGYWLYGGANAASGDYSVVLYDSDGTTPLATAANDGDLVVAAGVGGAMGLFASSIALLANTFYFLALKPTTTNNCALHNYTLSTAHGVALMDQIAGGQDFHWAQRTDAGAWSPDTSRRPGIGLVIDGVDDGLSGGSGVSRARVVNAGGL